MKKVWLLTILTVLAVCTLFLAITFWTIHSGKPKLKVEFNPKPPWFIRPQQNLQLSMALKNEGNAPARNVNINFTAPTAFIIIESGTNQYNESFTELREGEIKSRSLTLTVQATISPGNYTVKLVFYADNAPKETYNYQITVQLPP